MNTKNSVEDRKIMSANIKRIKVGTASCGLAAGAGAVLEALENKIIK